MRSFSRRWTSRTCSTLTTSSPLQAFYCYPTLFLRTLATKTTTGGTGTTTNTGSISILDKNRQELIDRIPLQDVRNFCFIAHVDHGKSSLSSRLLEIAGNLGPEAHQRALQPDTPLSKSKEQIQLLDTLSVERDRGITVKTTTATMLYPHPSAVGETGLLLLNLYDTPGHIDFGREVTRTLNFVQGAVLLLDATQGIQAQTWSVYEKAKSLPNPPKMIIALTKTDLESAKPVQVALSVSEWLGWDDPDTILLTSARNRIGIKQLLDTICEQVPPPTPLEDDHEGSALLRAQVVDSSYDSRGVNSLVQILSGELKETDRLVITRAVGSTVGDKDSSSQSYSVQEVGLVLPQPVRTGRLQRGQLGYIRYGLKDPRQALAGTILQHSHQANTRLLLPDLPSNLVTQSVLYASVHPEDADSFDELAQAVDRLALNDSGLEVSRTSSLGGEKGGPFLGPGLRVGFQGMLHVEVFRQRLLDEHGISAVITPPKVPYRVTFVPSKRNNLPEAQTKIIENLSEWPSPGEKFFVEEPMVDARIVARVEDAGAVMDLIQRKRGIDMETVPVDDEKWLFRAKLPWAEVVTDFHDQLKNVTAGYGSLDTSQAEDNAFKEAALSKVDILLNGDMVEPLSFVCHKDFAASEARKVAQKLQEVLPRQQFVTVIQAKADGKIIASERIKAYRKDVLTKSGKTVGGGDQTRKMKLLEKQKRGKKRMQAEGKVTLSQEAFNSVISRSS